MKNQKVCLLKLLFFGSCSALLFGLSYFELYPMYDDTSWEKRYCDFNKLNDDFSFYYTKGCYKIIETSLPKKRYCWIKFNKNICDIIFEQPKIQHIFIDILFIITIFGFTFNLSSFIYPSN